MHDLEAFAESGLPSCLSDGLAHAVIVRRSKAASSTCASVAGQFFYLCMSHYFCLSIKCDCAGFHTK